MTELHTALLIGVMSLGTVLLRFLPFAVFSGKRRVPKIILTLGDLLPSASLGMLVIYCLKDLSFTAASRGIPEILASLITMTVQMLKRNTILSIIAGTASYILITLCF